MANGEPLIPRAAILLPAKETCARSGCRVGKQESLEHAGDLPEPHGPATEAGILTY